MSIDDFESDDLPSGPSVPEQVITHLYAHRGQYWTFTADRERVTAAYDLQAVTDQLDDEDDGIDVPAWENSAPGTPHPSERDGAE